MPPVRSSPRLAAAVLVAGHAIDDLYQGAVPALVPFMVAGRHYGYLAAAGITLAATLLSSVAQPLFGLLTDHRRLPWLVPAGMALAGLGIAASGLLSSYLLTLLAIALSGLGVAIYHPESARLARAATRGSHIGMSWFALGGNVGFAAGPILVTPILDVTGLRGTPLLVVPALFGCLITVALLRARKGVSQAAAPAMTRRGEDNWPAFRSLSVVVICRSIVTFGLSTFLALFIEKKLHVGTNAGEHALAVLFVTGAAGTLLGGRLASRWGRIRTIRISYAATVPALAGLLWVPGPAVWLFVGACGLATYIPFSLQVTLGQDYLPSRIGTASGVTLGLAVSVGGLAAPLIGALAQASSLQAALTVLLVAPALSWLISRRLPEPRNIALDRPAATAPEAVGSAPADPP
jgi:FSR family fosmidomycin resistance protein-like MFS transporter